MKKISMICVISAILALLMASCKIPAQRNPAFGDPVETDDFLMGTVITQRVYGENAESAAAEVVERIKEIELKMTINQPGGEINKLNEMSGREAVKLSEDSFFVLERAIRFSELSQGAFDVTVGPLVKAWGIYTEDPRIPTENELLSLKKLVDYRKVGLDSEDLNAKLRIEGQIVDLGGIAKGYAGDEAIGIYQKHGIKSAFVNLGGNIVTHGTKPDGSPWRIGVQNPRAASGIYVGIIEVQDKAIVSSGDYERYFEKDGVRYHHIVDPRTGHPADSGLIGTTIVADFSIDADALSTAVFVLGLEKGRELIETLDGVEAVFITKDKKVYTTSGLEKAFTFKDEGKEYEYVKKR